MMVKVESAAVLQPTTVREAPDFEKGNIEGMDGNVFECYGEAIENINLLKWWRYWRATLARQWNSRRVLPQSMEDLRWDTLNNPKSSQRKSYRLRQRS